MTETISAKTCGQCGRDIHKATRIHNHKAFCATCYAREFKKASCLQCHKNIRIPKSADTGTCQACLKAKAQCARCEKPMVNNSVGIRLGDAFVCKSCTPYLKPEKQCEMCQQKTHFYEYLKGIDTHNHVICRQCAHSEYITCAHCHKYREFACWDNDKRPRCKNCLPGKEQYHACPSCKETVNGPGNSHCKQCSINHRALRRIQLNAELLCHAGLRQLFVDFGKHVFISKADHAVTRTIDRYALFFRQLEKHAVTGKALSQDVLLDKFGPETLRQHSHFVNYLIEHRNTSWDDGRTEIFRLNQRIENLRDASRGKVWRSVFLSFDEHLLSKEIKTRTRLAYLNACKRFLEHFNFECTEEITSDHFTVFIKSHKGLRASLHAFSAYIGIRISISHKKRPGTPSERKIIERCATLRNGLENARTTPMQKAIWITLVAELFQVPISHVVKLQAEDVRRFKGQYIINIDNLSLELPDELSDWLQRWITPSTGYIFEGRISNTPIDPISVRYHIKKL